MLRDDSWVLSAELKSNRCEGLCGLLRDNGTDYMVACVEDLIPLLVEQLGGFRDGSLNNSVARRIEILLEDHLHHRRCIRRTLTGLQHNSASCGYSANDWPYR